MKCKDDIRERWLSLYVENDVGVLAKISGFLSAKLYNVDSLTVGETEDPTLSRMTIVMRSDDRTLEQVIKQLNRWVEVIKVIDFTDQAIHKLEILFIKLSTENTEQVDEVFRLAKTFDLEVIDYGRHRMILKSVTTAKKNNEMIRRFKQYFPNHIELVRGGSVAIESLVD